MLIFALLAAWPARAAVSRLINFQGRVTDIAGTPVTATTPLVFRVYNVSSGGSALLTETQAVTPDADGIYSVNIGAVATVQMASLDFSQDLWLSVEVNGELLPGRYQLTTSPYAVYASSSALAAEAPWAGLTGVPLGFLDGTDDTTPGTGAVGSAQLLDGGVAVADMGSGSVGGTQIIDSTITASDLSTDAVTTAKVLDGTLVNADVSSSAELSPGKINGGSFQNEAYQFPAGAAIGGSTITAAGNLQMPSGATITIGSVTGTLLPSGTMILSIAACPTGFTEYSNAQGFYLVGMPSGGTAGGTVGSAMTDLNNATHSHTISTSQISNLTQLGGGTAVASVTSPSGTAARSSVAPYIQVRLCTAP